MPLIHLSNKENAEIAGALDTILSLGAEEGGEGKLLYRAKFRNIANSVNGALLLNQIWYYFQKKDYQPFYKFAQPCSHKMYRDGDSWTEVLNWSYDEFTSALKKIGTKVTAGVSKTEAYENSIIIYWTNSSQVTWYDMNLVKFAKEIQKAYGENALGNEVLSYYLETLEGQIVQKSVDSQLPVLIESSENNNKYIPADSGRDRTAARLEEEDSGILASQETSPVREEVPMRLENKKPDVVGSDILEHPFVKYFMMQVGLTSLEEPLPIMILGDIIIREGDKEKERFRGGLIQLWDNMPGFEEYAKHRIPHVLSRKKPTRPTTLLMHLCDLYHPAPTEEIPYDWIGFFAWRELNFHKQAS